MCKRELVADATETDDPSIVGEECHIVGESVDGPRGASDLPAAQRDKYSNLILLCCVDHKIIDDQTATYTVEILSELKAEHEAWVRQKLGADSQKQADDEIYATYIDEWATRIHLDEWQNWASWLISDGQPSVADEMFTALREINTWILSRVWPNRYPDLESSLQNFRAVAQDLANVFGKYAEKRADMRWQTKKIYRIPDYDPERYEALARQFDRHVDLVEDLALELTRAANYVCDRVRQCLMRSYRLKDGVLLITGGPYMNLTYKTFRVEYRGAERTDLPYPGLKAFGKIRFERDRSFGDPKDAETE